MASSDDTWISEAKIQQAITLSGDTPILRTSEVTNGLNSLVSEQRVDKVVQQPETLYRLHDDIASSVKLSLSNAGELWDEIVKQIFNTTQRTHDVYKCGFIHLLCRVFSVLSESNVRFLSRLRDGQEVADSTFLIKCITETCDVFGFPDQETFIYGVKRFFRDSDPKYNTLKWNMSQNFYIVKALGIDTSDLLSPSVFKDCSFYCDTNVLIKGLTPVPKYKGSLIELSKACKDIGISLYVARNTLMEFDSVLEFHSSLLRDNIGKVPPATLPKVHDFLLEAYLSEKSKNPELTEGNIVSYFTEPVIKLREFCDITEVDDVWFDEAYKEAETTAIATSIIAHCLETRRRHKSKNAAMHDAVLVRWIAKENSESNKSWIVTHDLTLAEWNTNQNIQGINVITIDALLQWMTPIAMQSNNDDTMAYIFSSALSEQLLPVENFITLQDFQVFDDMGIETQQLPPDDVEACVRDIRINCSTCDPSKAEDREKIGHIIQRFFADPGRKYKEALSELQNKVNEQNNNIMAEIKNRQRAEQKAEDAIEKTKELEEQVRDKDGELVSSNKRIDKLEKDIESLSTRNNLNQSKIKLIVRGIICAMLFLGIEFIVCVLILKFGEGSNWFVKITNNWAWVAGGLAASIMLSRIIIGKEGMQLIKHWKGE